MSLNTLTLAHKAVLAPLKELYVDQKLPHALLFAGPTGIGKQESALELSHYILGAGTGADLHVMTPEAHGYTIGQIRIIQDICTRTSYESKSRVFILSEAERLGVQPSNAFLKLLEEPPAHTYFILISARSYKLLPTLKSRLQTFNFQPLSEEDFKACTQELDMGLFKFMAENSPGIAKQIAYYKDPLEALAKLLPYPYAQEMSAYKNYFDLLEKDESFDFIAFFPLFEALLKDYYRYGLTGTSSYPWPSHQKNSLISFKNLSLRLKDLEEAFFAHMKLICCFERFFLNL